MLWVLRIFFLFSHSSGYRGFIFKELLCLFQHPWVTSKNIEESQETWGATYIQYKMRICVPIHARFPQRCLTECFIDFPNPHPILTLSIEKQSAVSGSVYSVPLCYYHHIIIPNSMLTIIIQNINELFCARSCT